MHLAISRARLGSAAFVALVLSACGNEAVGIEECRSIESARCEVAPNCEDTDQAFGISTEDQVRNCQTFYHDHCLLGIENDTETPSEGAGEDCATAIRAISTCKANGITDLAECMNGDEPVAMEEAGKTPCEAIATPEVITACAFIVKPAEE